MMILPDGAAGSHGISERRHKVSCETGEVLMENDDLKTMFPLG